ncbi:hypothetical protein ZWY2020_051368 [Hordeum vulgare]|nr:hypothetical protein ZWY2020_051368 [Hordeum vulgare]
MDAPNGNANGSGMCLPRNLLVDVLCRLSPRTLALCRATCSAWRAIVDDHGLLSPHYLPRSSSRIFISDAGTMGRPSSSAGHGARPTDLESTA